MHPTKRAAVLFDLLESKERGGEAVVRGGVEGSGEGGVEGSGEGRSRGQW